jgi:steroid 5-alpha reductase family enzyme
MRRVWAMLPFALAGVALLLDPATAGPARLNLAVQVVLFTLAAAIPGHLTRHVSYVDVAWPWGLVGIGLVTVFTADQLNVVTAAIAVAYLAMGARMGLWSLVLTMKHGWWTPGSPKAELPRYQYQRRRWERQGFRSEAWSVQYEIWLQGLANASVLAVPAFIVAADHQRPLSVWSLAALALWAASYVLESVADRQKQRFAAHGKRGTCDRGLWRYSRHPNYFFQWMQWNALVLLALPSLTARFHDTTALVWVLLALGLFFASWTLYVTLTKHTGARPAEYYSLRKRPDYARYQATTNMFFPGPVKTPPKDAE